MIPIINNDMEIQIEKEQNMYDIVVAFGFAGIMLCVGILIRGKMRLFQSMLMPASVIGGIIGFFIMNLFLANLDAIDTKNFSDIVDVFFVMSFISIGLTGSRSKDPKPEKLKKGSNSVNGAIGMALIWCILYALTPVMGILIITGIGKIFDMDPMYGILIPFAFCQGPGQASTYGRLFEYTYGFPNAEMTALTFAIIGFLSAFFIGVPLARYGIKRRLVRNNCSIDDTIQKGYFETHEQNESIGNQTFHSANVETLAAHIAVMGVTYLFALVFAKIVSLIPVIGPTLGAMLFMWGSFAAYIIRYVMQKLKIDYVFDRSIQNSITGLFSDYLVVCSFMAIQIKVIGMWVIPIALVSIFGTIITFIVCVYFCARLGSDHDFERLLGVYGTCTGTIPSGISLIRIVDPKMQTATGIELGIMNAGMIISTPTMIIITMAGLKVITLPIACGGMILTAFFYMALLKIFHLWGKPNFTLKK